MKEGLPVIRNGWFRVLLFLLAYVLCVMALGIALVTVTLTGKGNLTFDTATVLKLITVTSLTSLLLVTVFRIYIDRRTVKSMGLLPFSKDGLVGLLLSIALLGGGTMLLYFNGNLHWVDVSFDPVPFFTGFAVLLLAVFAEEMVFRGYILGTLLEVADNKWYALVLSAVLFALVHASNAGINLVAVLNLVLAGLLLGLNYIYTKNLWFAILFHFGWNFFQGLVLGYEVSGLGLSGILQLEMDGNPLLTGDKFGFEGSLIATFLLLAAILLMYWAFEKRKTAEV